MSAEELRARKARIMKDLDEIKLEFDNKIAELDQIQNNMKIAITQEAFEKVLNN